MTNIGASLDGAEMMTFLAGLLPFRWTDAFSFSVKMPVDSQT